MTDLGNMALISYPCRKPENRGPGENMTRSYTCMRCNKSWDVNDPGFVYWHVPRHGRLAGQKLDGREGKPRDSLGWFSHCADREACDKRRRNLHAGVAPEQMELVEVT